MKAIIDICGNGAENCLTDGPFQSDTQNGELELIVMQGGAIFAPMEFASME
jgi:hypothetical protein